MLKSKLLLFTFSIVLTGLLFLNTEKFKSQSEFKYVGVTTCVGACHKSEAQGNQYSIWKNTKHSQAFKTLQSAVADSIASSQGFTTAAAETPKCVKCHVLGKEIDESEFTETFDKTQGVQCESCHGSGSEYKKLSIMKDRQKSIEAGLIIHTEKEAFCTHCHNSESPTFVSFDYDTMWPKIAHPKPKE